MSAESWVLLVALILVSAAGFAALVLVIHRLLGHHGDLEQKLMAMSQVYPHAAYIDLQRAQLEATRPQYAPPPQEMREESV